MLMIFPVVIFSFHFFFLLIFFFIYIFYSVLKMNLNCFSAVLQCLSNETGNHFVHYNFYKQFEMIRCRGKSTFRLREEFIYSSLVKQILLCPSLPCNQIFILPCKILVATEISVLVAHWLPWTILFRYACLEILEWWLSFNWSS